jgi:hypothetical protein
LRQIKALRSADAVEIDVIGGRGFSGQPLLLALLGAGEFDGLDGGNGVSNAGGDVLPHFVVGRESDLEAQGRFPRE